MSEYPGEQSNNDGRNRLSKFDEISSENRDIPSYRCISRNKVNKVAMRNAIVILMSDCEKNSALVDIKSTIR